jgi:hypothetical protein
LPSTGNGRLPIRKLISGHRAPPIGSRRRAETPGLPPPGKRRWNEILSSASVILAGVLVVIGFGFVASRAMRSSHDTPNVSVQQAPALGEVTLPSDSSSQGVIPLTSPSSSPSPSRSPSSSPAPSPTTARPTTTPPDPGSIALARGSIPSTVDLTAEGTRDWVHWGEQGTFSLERDKNGGFAILEGAPTAPRFRHALSPQRFSWNGGDPVDHSDGTPTGIRTCGAGNAFTISAPAGTATRTLRLYVGVISARGQLSASLSAGSATTSATLEQPSGSITTAVLTLRYRALKDGKINIKWNTAAAFGTGCGGVTLEAATLQ